MRRSVERASRLVDASLERAQPGDALLSVRRSAASLAEMIDECIASFQPLAAARSITLQGPSRESLEGTVNCDKQRVLQVLANLLGNSLKFTPSGGTVRLDARREANGVRFIVTDTGGGISADDLAHCFDRFWHGNSAAHGTGLGLWIAKTVVEAHGGQISAESELGRGTTMSFVLPSEIPPTPTLAPSLSPAKA
jgi:signal transduction histidine kinase